MARLLVQLKLRLLANALRSSNRAKASFITSTAFAVLTALGMFALLASLHGQSTAVDLTSVLFTVFAFGWLILPLLAFGLDSTLDPATMALYPLRTRQLATGLLAASATGAWPAANVIGLLGVLIGLASGVLGVLVALVAVPLQVLFCITLARFVTTSMAGLLRSRRGKDLAAFLFIPIVAGYEFFTQVVPRLAASGKLTTASFAGPRRMDALAATGTGRARDPGRLGRAPRHRPAAPGAAGRHHCRARLAVDPVAEPRPGLPRLLHPVIAGARRGAAVWPVRPARRGGRPILDLSAA